MPKRHIPSYIAARHSVSKSNQALLNAIFATATDYAIITTDRDGTIVTWNAGAESVFGYAPDQILGQPIARLFTPEDVALHMPQQEMASARDTGRSTDYRWHLRRDGRRFWADGVMTPIRDANGGGVSGYLKIMRDSTDKKRAELDLLRMAKLDALTGLANRASFTARLQELMAGALRQHALLLLLLLDIDRFKQVNDRWGHIAGDQLLRQAVRRMQDVTRDTDFIARLGGDEFVVLQPDAHSAHDGGALAQKLLDALARPFLIDGNEILSGASIGITVYPIDAADPEQLLKNADLALYEVKHGGGNGYHYFTERLDRETHRRGTQLAALKQAIATQAFELVYQPEVDADSGRTVAMEALLRCRDPVLAAQPISDVVQLAISAGMMSEIGKWVLRQACAQMRAWRDAGLAPRKVCVNLCPRELLETDLAEQVSAILEQAGLAGPDLELEITEHQRLGIDGQAAGNLARLRALGVSVAIDDFGTGYSSLSYLRNLPVDRVKLDRSFLRRIPADPDSCAIASAIIVLAHTLKLDMVVEGVESAEQARFFRRQHSDTLQGFYFSAPLKADAMAAWLAREAARPRA